MRGVDFYHSFDLNGVEVLDAAGKVIGYVKRRAHNIVYWQARYGLAYFVDVDGRIAHVFHKRLSAFGKYLELVRAQEAQLKG